MNSEGESLAVGASAVELIEEQTVETMETVETDDWAAVLGAVQMVKAAELAEIKWSADAEVNKWVSRVETAVEMTRGTIKEKVEEIEAEDHKVKFEFGSGAQVA